MIRRRIQWVVSLLLLTLVLTGCWDQRTIGQRETVLAIAVSAHDEWTFLFPNVITSVTNLASISSAQQYYALSTRADSWPQAELQIQREASHHVSLGDLEILLLSHRLTTGAVAQIVNSINMDGAIPASFWVAVSLVSPQTLLLQNSPQAVVPSYYLSGYFNCYGCHGAILGVPEWEWWARESTPGISPILPVFASAPNGASIHQMAVYPTHGKPWLMSPTVTQGYNYLMGHVVKGSISIPVAGGSYVMSHIHDTTHLSLKLTQNAVDATIHITATGNMIQAPIGTPVTRATELLVGNAMGNAILDKSLLAIQWANATHTDPFGYAKRAAWLDNRMALEIPTTELTSLPIHATIIVRGIVQGEGVAQ